MRRTSNVAHLVEHGVERFEGGLDEEDTLARAVEDAGVVVHLAAVTRGSAKECERANAQGTRTLVNALLQAKSPPKRLVYLSSLAAVGPSVDGRPVSRGAPPHPLTAYGRSKLAGEEAVLSAGNGLEVVVIRAPAVYGPRDRDLYTYFRLAARGLLPVPSGPERPVQLIHAADLAEALVDAATVPMAAGIYHVADPSAYPWREVARMIAVAVGRSARLVSVPSPLVKAAGAANEWLARAVGRSTIFNRDKVRELLAPGWLCETDAARTELGFEPRFRLHEGLVETARWYRAYGWL